MNMARWLTVQSRFLRVYMAQLGSSDELATLARYIVAVYEPTIMAIRHRPDLVEATRHLFDELQLQRRHLSGASLDTVQKSLARNGMMAHPENIALAMLGDDQREVRSEVVKLIREARGRRQLGQVRQFKCPDIDMAATRYTELTDLKSYAERADIEPPCTCPTQT